MGEKQLWIVLVVGIVVVVGLIATILVITLHENGGRSSESSAEEYECKVIENIGNGICEDSLNVLQCNFDGGDCCRPDRNTDSCILCICNKGT